MSQDLLLEELHRRKQKNSKYSLRCFARDLGVSASHLSNLISGRKPLTVRQASLFVSKLKTSPSLKANLLRTIAPKLHDQIISPEDIRRLREEEFALISDWYYLAILNLLRLPRLIARVAVISRRLGISERQTEEAIEKLERLGFLSRKNGILGRTVKLLRTTNNIPSERIKKYHRQNLEIAKIKLESTPMDLRFFYSITMPTNLKKLAIAKKMIEEFNEQMSNELDEGDCQEVYTLNVQLFPLTQKEKI